MPTNPDSEIVSEHAPVSHGWNEYRRLVISELERLDSGLSQLADRNDKSAAQLYETLNGIKETILSRINQLQRRLETRVANAANAADQRLKKLEADVLVMKTKAALLGAGSAVVVGFVGYVIQLLVTWASSKP